MKRFLIGFFGIGLGGYSFNLYMVIDKKTQGIT